MTLTGSKTISSVCSFTNSRQPSKYLFWLVAGGRVEMDVLCRSHTVRAATPIYTP